MLTTGGGGEATELSFVLKTAWQRQAIPELKLEGDEAAGQVVGELKTTELVLAASLLPLWLWFLWEVRG